MSAADLTVDAAGIDIAVRDYGGSGSPILLVHGAGRTLADWCLLAPLLTENHRVLAVDLRCHGRSGDGPFSMAAAVEDLHAVVEALGLEDVAIVGHSLGGMLAAQYGARFPLRAAVNLDGHGLAADPSLFEGYEPAEVASKRAQLDAVQTPPAEVRVLSAEELETQVAALTAVLGAQGLAAEHVRDMVDRTVVVLPDGGLTLKPLPRHVQAILAEVDALDLPADYVACLAPLLVYNATNPDPRMAALPIEGLADFMAAYRQGLARRLSALAEEHAHISYRQVDATHALLLEVPELICEQVEKLLA